MIKLKEIIESNGIMAEKYFLLLKHEDAEIPFFYVGKINSPAERSMLMGSWMFAWRYNKVFTEEQIKKILKNNSNFMKSQRITKYALEKYSNVVYFDAELGYDRAYDDEWDYTKRNYFLYKNL